jgi:hypothetical protein
MINENNGIPMMSVHGRISQSLHPQLKRAQVKRGAQMIIQPMC